MRAPMKTATEVFRPRRTTAWTSERVDRLQPAEIEQLRTNAAKLGEQDVVALCDQSLDRQRPASPSGRGARRKAPLKGQLISRRNAFEAQGVYLASAASWGGVRKSDGRVVMALWASAIQSRDGGCRYLLWAPNVDGSRPWSDSPAGKERLAHCELIGKDGRADALLVRGESLEGYLPEDKARTVQGVDRDVSIVFTLERQGQEYWAVWGKKAPRQEL